MRVQREFEGHFAGLRDRTLCFPFCEDCAQFHWYPMKICPHCRSRRVAWKAVNGPGTVFSWTVVRHAFDPSYKDKLPYVVALVTFADAPHVRLVTNLVETPLDSIHIGMSVSPVYELSNSDDPRVVFRPSAAA